ncbi:MAG: ABC transporter permease subunit [Dermatophilaceae bacterium]
MSAVDRSVMARPAPTPSPSSSAVGHGGPAAAPGGSDPGRRRSLGVWSLLRSELGLIGGRRRNQMGLLVLAAVPVLIAVATRMSSRSGGGGFFGSITDNGLFVAVAALTVEIPMFLPLAMSMLAGDAIAGEANQGTLRYLLTVPVSRTRLLFVKYLALVVGGFWGLAVVVGTGLAVGVGVFGAGPATTLSGTRIGFGEASWRLVLAVLYLGVFLAALSAIGLFVSTLTEQPIAATIAVMIVNVTMWILTGIAQLSWLHPYLLVHRAMSFADVFRDPMWFGDIGTGLALAGGYILVFVALAWARLSGKDITS